MKRSQPTTLDEIFEAQIQVLATTLRPRTVESYRSRSRRFLAYLRATFPQLHKPSQLRRDPHLLGWFRFLCQQHPPLRNQTRKVYLLSIRRLLCDLADQGHPLPPDLIRHDDLPPHDHYLPKPLSPEEDERLEQQLRHTDKLEANALRLMRATGIRIGECIALPLDCLRQVSDRQTALHVPLGKLHSERWVPVAEETQRIVARMVELRALAPASAGGESGNFLLPRRAEPGRTIGSGRLPWYHTLHRTLAEAAQRAGCTSSVTPHRLRHSFASEMLRLGVSLPALMHLLGHKDIRMTLRYVQVTQQDLQREFHRARQNITSLRIPQLALPSTTTPVRADLSTVRDAIATVRHLLHLFRAQLENATARRKLHRLAQRLLNISRELDHFGPK